MVIGPAQAESSIPQRTFLLLLTPKSPSHLVPSEIPAFASTFRAWFSWINLSLCGLETLGSCEYVCVGFCCGQSGGLETHSQEQLTVAVQATSTNVSPPIHQEAITILCLAPNTGYFCLRLMIFMCDFVLSHRSCRAKCV